MDVAQLLALAEEALVVEGTSEATVDRVARYAEALQIFQDEQSSKNSTHNEEELQRLAELHSQILKRADTLRQATGDELKHLKRRGKAIMAYVDKLPRNIGIQRGRKG